MIEKAVKVESNEIVKIVEGNPELKGQRYTKKHGMDIPTYTVDEYNEVKDTIPDGVPFIIEFSSDDDIPKFFNL